MRIKETFSNMWQKLKNQFGRQGETSEPAESAPEPSAEMAFEPLSTDNPQETPASRTAEEPEVSQSDDPAAPIPSRMTDEYKEWLQQQREAADAENNIENTTNEE